MTKPRTNAELTELWRPHPEFVGPSMPPIQGVGMEKYRLLDLFSGVGGFSLGLERTGGFETVAFCEIQEFQRLVLAKHWPKVTQYDDIRTLSASRLAERGIFPNAICGGFPCQDISLAGDGAGIEGERSGLWKEYARLIGEIRPEVVIVENVSALLGRGIATVLGDLASLGFDAEWHCIPVGRLGAPHIRDRVWIIAYSDSWRRRSILAGRHVTDRQDAGRSQANRVLGAIFKPDCEWYLADSVPANDHGERRRQYHGAEIAVQPEISGLAGPISHDGWRTPWPRFLADILRVDDGIRNRMDKAGFAAIGNAVSPAIPEMIGRAILAATQETAA
jgi:DNA (cytosine-5)-methyltransferase 1